MKQALGLVVLLCIPISLVAIHATPNTSFTITGKYLTPSSEDPSTEENSESESQDGWQAASVAVTYEVTDNDGDIEVVEVATGEFVDGNIELVGEIDAPRIATITVSSGSGLDTLQRTALIQPGGDVVSFAIVDRQVSYRRAQLVLTGAADRVQDQAKKFTVTGDFRSMQDELSLGIITVSGPGLDSKGELARITHGSVLLEDGIVIIESEILEPSVLFVTAMAGENAFNEYYGMIEIVVEPNSEIVIEPRGWSRELVAAATGGRHDKLVDSWQQSKEYQELLDRYANSYKDFRDAWEESWKAQQAAAKTANTSEAESASKANETTESKEAKSSDEESVTDEVDEVEPVLAFSGGKPPTTGCEHVQLADEDTTTTVNNNPEYHILFLELLRLKTEALEAIASNSEDPMDVLLAMELGAYGYNSDNIKKSVPLYDEIATILDKELVARRVTPARDDIASFIEKDEKDKSLVPGQVAPNFTLPDLKELYSSYHDDGFEIISISLDSTSEIWEEASGEHELPWINLGDIAERGEGLVANSYGVISIPKSFLVDQQGCINHRDLSPEDLETVLKSRYGYGVVGASDETMVPSEQKNTSSNAGSSE